MQEVPLLPLWVTVFLTIWAAVGPLAGILLGHYLTRSWQRQQWIADNQKEEYRRLLAGLNRLNVLVIDRTPLTAQEVKQATDEITEAVSTSLFIHDFLQESKVLSRVIRSIEHLAKENTTENYHKEHWIAVNQIIAAAKKHTG